MFLRFETDVDMSRQKLDKLEQVRQDVAQTMQGALGQFEAAVRELDKVAPAKRLVTQLEAPTRRSVPTFGRQKAQEAARRFDQGVEQSASAALSTPILLAAEVTDVPEPKGTTDAAAPAPAPEPAQAVAPVLATEPTGDRREFDADDEFADLLLQP
jgi:hypothetical protein